MSKLQIQRFTLGELDTNCYLVWCDNTREAVVIDPGDAGESIAEQIISLQLIPKAILLTHGHFDHVLGTLALQLSFDIPVYLHQADEKLLKSAQGSAEHWLKHPVDPVPPATHQLQDDQSISVGECFLKVLHTPGHTPGSCSLYWQTTEPSDSTHFDFGEPSVAFVGDVIFKDGIGRTDHGYSSKRDLFASIQKIRDLGSLRIYAGHGESFFSEDNPLLQQSS